MIGAYEPTPGGRFSLPEFPSSRVGGCPLPHPLCPHHGCLPGNRADHRLCQWVRHGDTVGHFEHIIAGFSPKTFVSIEGVRSASDGIFPGDHAQPPSGMILSRFRKTREKHQVNTRSRV